jgi:hypothetical protein
MKEDIFLDGRGSFPGPTGFYTKRIRTRIRTTGTTKIATATKTAIETLTTCSLPTNWLLTTKETTKEITITAKTVTAA